MKNRVMKNGGRGCLKLFFYKKKMLSMFFVTKGRYVFSGVGL